MEMTIALCTQEYSQPLCYHYTIRQIRAKKAYDIMSLDEKPLCPEIRITAYQYFNRQHLRSCPSSKEIVRPTLIMDLSICPDATSRDAVLLLQPRYSARPLMPCIRLDALCWRSARCSSIHSSNCATVRSVTIVVGVISISILWIKWMIRLCVLNGYL